AGSIDPRKGERADVSLAKFSLRFADRGPWDLADWRERRVQKLLAPPYAEVLAQGDSNPMFAMLRSMMQAAAAPHRDEVLHRGRLGEFYRASMADLEGVPSDLLQQCDHDMAELGFRQLGDVVWQRMPEFVIRR